MSDRLRVVAAIARRDREVLVCRRASGKPHAGRWEFPGGKVEAGETLARALRRELREELEVEAKIGREVWRTVRRGIEGRELDLRFFAVQLPSGPLGGADHFAEVRWQPIERLGALDFLDADRELVAALAAGRINVLGEKTRARPPADTGRAARASTNGRSRGAPRDR